jgi:signal transduction histidine kinase
MDHVETTIYTAVVIGCIVIGLLITIFAFTLYRNHQRHFQMLRSYNLKEVELLEQERTRIARDLHDELGPLLSIVNIYIYNSRSQEEDAQHYLDKATQIILQLTDRFAEISKNLTPAVLIKKGLYVAINSFLDHFRTNTGILFHLDYQVDCEVGVQFELHVYRMVQELVHNAVKHSRATEVSLLLIERKGILYLSYKDNGKGMPSPENHSGIGISSLNSRTILLSGRMEIVDHKLGAGTEYFFELPITNECKAIDSDFRTAASGR